ncbi:MAG: hypothetical protein COX62_08580 [Deltaproteobacteria bacterium CG_4_10_14_0_2_um_filter_43_8]|nr:MAG: hypothetical protein COV43_01305 [Deltaproteobacteria bacterium CG11_big_fil_rev_8_21_14_0_20_42_23]PJA18529.1 MAG: hypothetical protein COX62_08580 [Deltaproteobacteria bacterium CG_4_10_14_0_2_um_filter_43_8]PJC63304.1 MAG: hypothetical protein CO021_10130 [Deltaproteobacteria bacterium CG_4_9_14_0_2_um_filter_42_21]
MIKFLSRNRHFFLLIGLFLFYALFTLSTTFSWAGPVVLISFSLVLLASIISVSTNKKIFSIALLLGVVALGLDWYVFASHRIDYFLFTLFSKMAVLGFTIGIMLYKLLEDTKEVTLNTIYGSMCVYIMLGIFWGMLFVGVEHLYPGSFYVQSSNLPFYIHPNNPFPYPFDLFYFSFVTITTVGYGDIVPATPLTQSLSALEALLGQFYMVILVARFVGLHIHHHSTSLREKVLGE